MTRGSFWMLAVIFTAPVALAVTIAAIPGCGPVAEAQPEQPAVLVQPQPRTVVVQQQAPPPQLDQPDQPAPTAAAAADPGVVHLVAPVALYPDPLLANTFPACSYPQEVQEAGQFLEANPQPTDDQINGQAWGPEVKAIVRYPTVVQTLNGDPQWTQSLGSAFTTNQQEVWVAVQDLRQQAVTAGSLKDTPQVTVVQQDNVIAVQPANPEVVYVPAYDPVLVYTQPVVVTYGVAYPTGIWLVDGIAWSSDVVFVGDWHGGYVYGPSGWYRDRSYRYDQRTVTWAHNDRWGRAPRIPPARWSDPRAFRGRALPATVVNHVTQRIRTTNIAHPKQIGASPEHFRPPVARPNLERSRPPALNPGLDRTRPPVVNPERTRPPTVRPGLEHAKPPVASPEHTKPPAPGKPAPQKGRREEVESPAKQRIRWRFIL